MTIALDLETTGLNWRRDHIIGVAAKSETQCVFDQWPMLIASSEYIFHNAKFDLKFIKQSGVELQGQIHDTMLLSYVLNPEREGGHSLANLSRTILGKEHPEIKDLLGTGKAKRRLADIPLDELAEKSKRDVEHTFELFFVLKQQCSPVLWQLYEKLEIPTMLALMDMEMTGITVDVDYLKWLRKTTRTEIWKALKNLRRWPHINYNSPKQVGELLYKKLRLQACKVTDKGQPSTDTEVLRILSEVHDVPRHLLAYRDAKKRLSTYIQPLMEEHDNGTTYPNFNQHITATGRLSSSDPINWQNIPSRTESGNRIRQAVVPRPGHTLVEADYSQIEPRLMDHFSRDPNLFKAINSKLGLYPGVVQQILECSDEEATEKKALGKLFFLAMGYGAQPQKLVKAAKLGGVDITELEAEVFIKRAELTYATLFEYKQKVISQASQDGFITTICGRRRYFEDLKSTNKWIRFAEQREAFNAVIQGTAADIMKLALIKLHQAGYNILLTVHDSVLIEMDSEDTTGIRKIMESVIKLRATLKVDIKVTNAWGGNREQVREAA